MKIIEALKKREDLKRKADDIRAKIRDHSADRDIDVPAYETVDLQKKQIEEWLQAHSDILKEIERLSLTIQRTNLEKEVSVEVEDGKFVTKCIAAWILRRRELAKLEAGAWSQLTDRNIMPQSYKKNEADKEVYITNVRKYYDQKKRDEMLEKFTSEPSRIDAALEIANATTDLV